MVSQSRKPDWSQEEAYVFGHVLFREAAQSLCSEPERASLSALAFEIMQDEHHHRQQESSLRELLIHARAARHGDLPLARARAISEAEARLLARAAHFETSRNNVASAAEIHQDLAGLQSAPAGVRVESLIEAGRLLNLLGSTTRAAEMLRDAVAQSDLSTDQALQCTARLRLGNVLRRRGDDSLAILLRAEELGRAASEDLSVAECLSERGLVYDSRAEYERAEECYVAAERIFRRKGKLAGVCRVLGNLAGVHASRGHFESALTTYHEAQDLAEILGDARLLGLIYGNRANVLSDQGDFEAASKAYEQALKALRTCGDWRSVVTTLANVGALQQERGDLDAAERHFSQAEEAAREIGDARLVSRMLGNRGLILAQRGRLGPALALYAQALHEARALADRPHEIVLLSNIGLAWRDQGALTKSLKCFDEAIAVALSCKALHELAALYTHRARVLLEAGEGRLAQAAAISALEFFEQTGALKTRTHFLCLMVLVTFEHDRGNAREARFLAVEARELSQRLELLPEDRDPEIRKNLELLARLRPKSARIPSDE